MSGLGGQFYEEEDAEQILRIAAAQTAPVGAVSRESLLATAAELGITPEALAEAEARYVREKAERNERETFEAEQRRSFFSHATVYAVVIIVLLVFNLFQMSRLTNPFFDLWAIGPILGWGMALFYHGLSVFKRNSEPYRQAFETWRKARRAPTEETQSPRIGP